MTQARFIGGSELNNSDKIVLNLCGGMGSWSKPYADVGYDVRVIKLPEHVITYRPPDRVHGILAAPQGTMTIVKACLRIIWDCQARTQLSFWALLNSKGPLRRYLGKPIYTFEQWEFGDFGKTPIDLWGYFSFPAKTLTPPGFARAFFEVNP